MSASRISAILERDRHHTIGALFPIKSIGSPYDSDARYAMKRETHWIGYKLHLTETYSDDQPNLITNVETTNAAVSDDAVTEL